MSGRIFSTMARGAAALALLAVVGLNARNAEAQYCGFYFGCTPGIYGAYGSYAYPYSYYPMYYSTGYFGYPSSQYYGYPFYYGDPYFGYFFDIFGYSYPVWNYPRYTTSSTYYGFYGTPYRGYYGYGWWSNYGLPTASMVYPWSVYYNTNERSYCFPC